MGQKRIADLTPARRIDAASRTPWTVRRIVAITVLAYVACIVVKLVIYRFDASRFFAAGDYFFSVGDLTYPVAVKAHSVGYDGQFFYRLALDPATTGRIDHGIAMEVHPAVRAQRILYPAAAWAVSLGQGALVPWTLLLVNLVAVAAVACAATLLALRFEVPAKAGLLLPFYPGFVVSICGDTAEIVAAALALGGLAAASGGRWPLAALLAGAAVLARETTLLYMAGFGLIALAEDARRRAIDRRIVCCLVPVAVFAGWQVALKAIWGDWPLADLGHHDLAAVPLAGYARALAHHSGALATGPLTYRRVFAFLTCLSVAAFVLFVGAQIARRGRAALPFVLPWLLYLGLAAVFTDAIWGDPQSYWRILCDLYVLGVAALIAGRDEAALRRLMPFVAAGWAASVAFVL